HLEVEKKQTILPPAAPPQGAVASLSLNPAAGEATPPESRATLAAPAEATLAGGSLATSNLATANVIAKNSEIPPAAPPASVAESEVPSTSQDSHV
ncbi:MAG: hypothetical protein WBW36_10665, partial [Candidatus Sulfotelmatobacter sp.]